MNTPRTTYPNSLLKQLNIPSGTKISEKQMVDFIISKCDKMSAYNASRYRIPKKLYMELITEQWELNHINNSSNETFVIRPSEIKNKLKNIMIAADTDQYVILSSIFSTNPVFNIEVSI